MLWQGPADAYMSDNEVTDDDDDESELEPDFNVNSLDDYIKLIASNSVWSKRKEDAKFGYV